MRLKTRDIKNHFEAGLKNIDSYKKNAWNKSRQIFTGSYTEEYTRSSRIHLLHQHHPRLAIARARGVPLNNLRKVRAVAALTQLLADLLRGEAVGKRKKSWG